MKFPAPRNSAKPEFPAPLLHVAPQRLVKDLADPPKILSRGGNSGPGGGISGPGSKFLVLKLTLLWMISSLSTVVPFPTSLHHQSCAIPGEFLQCLAQD
jgi:hypothetical protein